MISNALCVKSSCFRTRCKADHFKEAKTNAEVLKQKVSQFLSKILNLVVPHQLCLGY